MTQQPARQPYRKPPPVPFTPQPLEQLQKRYPRALEEVYDEEAMFLRTATPPGKKPEHVFDFDDGVRLIVSRTRMARNGKIVLHFSASVKADSPFWEEGMRLAHQHPFGQVSVLMALANHFVQLTGNTSMTVDFLGYSEAMVPHWRVQVLTPEQAQALLNRAE